MKMRVLLIIALCSIIYAFPEQDNNLQVEDDNDDDQKCPPWGKWQTSKCLWPSQPLSSIPKSCISLPKKPKIPDVLKQFVQSKQQEVYSVVQSLFKIRGANEACGYCSRKIRCRQRQNGEWKKGCKFVQAQLVQEQCAGTKACEISSVLGACPPPVPLPARRRRGEADLDGVESVATQILSDGTLDIEVTKKNASLGPPLWHCIRTQNGSKCLCCCGWYFPDGKSGKCVRIKNNTGLDMDHDDEDGWTWSGLINPQFPFERQNEIGDDVHEPTGIEPEQTTTKMEDEKPQIIPAIINDQKQIDNARPVIMVEPKQSKPDNNDI